MDADYIVIGTGSAGSVVANRLSADPSVQVVVLEAGPRDKDKFIHIPAAFSKLFRSPVDWDYLTESQKQLDGREIYWPRGKTLGGSSSMNAMMWVRGFAADYDEWGSLAGNDWDFAHVQKYFDRIENGPLVISPQRSPRSSTAAWLTAAQQCGYRLEAPNADAPEGFCETRVTQRRGARWSTADAYLKPALRGLIGKIVRPLGATSLDDETLERALNSLSHTIYHAVAICRMGSDDASVVDPQLRVRGIEGLRVADASVMPTIIRGHTHAPSVLIGEKAADLIRG